MTTEPNFTAGQEPEGKVAALIAWALFILSIPSANVLVLVGLVVSYVARGTAVGVARQHIEAQISLFWSVFWWTIAAWIGIAVSALASVFLVGIPFLLLFVLIWFLLSVWFTVKSVLGLINLLQNRPI
ncbi:MAG: hypothetical protein KJ728_06520 [Alphaproteobacteria bacterium]|jgi:uncharacterized membrane protein|uniref:membrane protein n=1 Tax=unclassified Brevundimonas TaxID=2622653 RepID=UPI0004A8AAA9|nr:MULTISPECIES: membrane protein [unclassified Brevundimonas]MBU1271219.1 hypothetical protein [Alphaproteobacteria bacterium]KDP93682.1 membrane protein [Brevundimonas sp. EAKA]MBJ7318585.1 hypothetical protein [Brevundimonas sp.]MBU1521060.1 hypothetical protein [Alphaproteobacteria bacterium]MBU2028992.1 hypothetical protein [Alphaproteobacteria bacterium]